jgi:hypothetical protein
MHIIKHFQTITKHRHQVRKICFKIGIPWQGLTHDLSKYSFKEFFVGAKYYLGNRSPNVMEREKYGYSSAWLHHKGRNKHHFEYWYDIGPSKKYEPVKMPLKYVKEMFADRVAACKIYRGKNYQDSNALDYLLEKEYPEVFHPETYQLLKSWLTKLKDEGEKKTFKFIKKVKNY